MGVGWGAGQGDGVEGGASSGVAEASSHSAGNGVPGTVVNGECQPRSEWLLFGGLGPEIPDCPIIHDKAEI